MNKDVYIYIYIFGDGGFSGTDVNWKQRNLKLCRDGEGVGRVRDGVA